MRDRIVWDLPGITNPPNFLPYYEPQNISPILPGYYEHPLIPPSNNKHPIGITNPFYFLPFFVYLFYFIYKKDYERLIFFHILTKIG